jgi:hypothetical protein
MPLPTQEELENEKRILSELRESLLHVFMDASGFTMLNHYADSVNPDLGNRKRVYRISTLEGDFEISHHTRWKPAE